MSPHSFLSRALHGAGLLAVGALVQTAQATPVFVDHFDAGLAQWASGSSGVVVADPLHASNPVLAFAQLGSGGDLFSAASFAGGSYRLSFDMLGTCTSGSCGGYVGIDDAQGEQWLVGDASYPAAFTLINNGAWQHVDVAFTAVGNFRLKLEDFAFSNLAGDVYFDNLCISQTIGDSGCSAAVSDVPEPATLALAGLALAGVVLTRRRRV